jgi:hypothetical protein
VPVASRKLGVAGGPENCEQPGLEGWPTKAVETAQRAQITFLHGIRRIRLIAHQKMRERIGVIDIRQRRVSKTPRALIFSYRIVCHGVEPFPVTDKLLWLSGTAVVAYRVSRMDWDDMGLTALNWWSSNNFD